jgi:hypothetical protein
MKTPNKPGDLCKVFTGDVVRELIDSSDAYSSYLTIDTILMKDEIWMYLSSDTSTIHTFLRPNGKRITIYSVSWELNWVDET